MFYLFASCLDSEEKQVQLITTLDNSEVDLLTLEYIKVCIKIYSFTVVSQSFIISNDYFPHGDTWLSD